ncbi:MAG: hypothetical protein DRO73_08360 [Candidatus Thorarchaeota archaeon]|nr:MAG: hypothetical protein DRO73_08360 [Candidatus Thorarchaeota archaeon]
MPGLVVRKSNGDLRWYPFFRHGEKFSFYPDKDYGESETGFKVGRGFNFVKYLPGYWMPAPSPVPHRRIGGGNSLVVLEKDGDLKFYRFEEMTFFVKNTGHRVGRGFKAEWDYFVAEWTGNGTSDLLVRDEDGHLRLFPWNGEKFVDLGREEKVGDGFHKDRFTHLLPGYWTGREFPDLVVREENGNLWLYPFNGKTFKGQGKPRKIGRGFGDQFTHYFVDEWMGNGTPDLIVRHKNGKLIRYPYGMFDSSKDYYHFSDPPYATVGRGFKGDWVYIVGHWRTPGHPDLLVCDNHHKMRFYPFENGEFVELPKSEKYVGNDWKFTHFFDFYPVEEQVSRP